MRCQPLRRALCFTLILSEFEDGIINIRILLALTLNIIAIILSIIWCYEMNWQAGFIHYESILSTITLFMTLSGLNFLNDRIGRPTIKLSVKAITVYSKFSLPIDAVALDIVNHSLTKVFISNIQVENDQRIRTSDGFKNKISNLVIDGTSGKQLARQALEPGEKFRFTMTRDQFGEQVPQQFGRLIVTTETEHKFYVSKKKVRDVFSRLET